MYRLNPQSLQQHSTSSSSSPSASTSTSHNQNQSSQHQQHVLPSHILLQQQLHAAAGAGVISSPAISIHPTSSNNAATSAHILASNTVENLGLNGALSQQQQSIQLQQHQHQRVANATLITPSIEDKIKILTSAIKTEPLNEVIALTTTLSNNNNNNGNSNNNIIALAVTPSSSNNQTTAIIVPMPSNLSNKNATLSSSVASGSTINLVVSNQTVNNPAATSISQTQGNAASSSNTINNGTNGNLVFVPNKRARLDTSEDWLSTPSPGSIPSSAPPLSPSPGPQNHSYGANMSNGYASPMSVGSYDPYSPTGKQGREDLSPSSSLNGYTTNDGCDAKKSKKGPAPRLQEELCLVCGDRASGYHYNALTCEGCKGFFRRSVTKNAVYVCKFGRQCEMDMYMRRKCQECRLKKCLAVGMRPECVVPETQCAMKRREKKAQKDKDKQTASPASYTTEYIKKKEMLELMACEQPLTPSFPLLTPDQKRECQAHNVPQLTHNQLAVIYKLIWYQDGYEQPSEDDLRRIMSSPDENESQTDVSFRHITEITILTVQLIVEFAKGLPAFTKIPQEDQITLLKACSSEVMMLRMARRYDHSSDSIFFANNRSYTRDSYKMAGMADNIEDLLHFCRQMYSMKVDNVEYALLTAIVIFSDRPGLEEAELVEAIQSYYIDTLRIYILNRHCGNPMCLVFFAKLLSILTELRTLGNQNAEMCFSLKLKNRKLPKFLEEIWDVHGTPPTMQATVAKREIEAEDASTSSAAAAAANHNEESASNMLGSSGTSNAHLPTSTTSISLATSTSNLGSGNNIYSTTNLPIMDVTMAHHDQILGNPSEHSTLA